MDLIDRTKLPFKEGDQVTFVYDNKIHTIIGYYFGDGFNNYNSNYGYVIDNRYPGHKAFLCGYDKEGNHLNLNDSTNDYVLTYHVKLINTENMKEFTKKDLKTGMIVELATGTRYLLVNNTLIGATGQMNFSHYNENLIYDGDSIYNINKVYLKEDCYWGLGFNRNLDTLCNTTLLWERPEIIEMSVEEIAEKLGIPANQLRIKK